MQLNRQDIDRLKQGLGSGLGLFLDLGGPAAWGLAAFFAASRLLSPTAGALLALGVFLSALAVMLGARLQESTARRLAQSVCPRCRGAIGLEHQHRRWDASRSAWLPPLTTWQCRACDFVQDESLACPACPEAA
jgi:hypothetical protein